MRAFFTLLLTLLLSAALCSLTLVDGVVRGLSDSSTVAGAAAAADFRGAVIDVAEDQLAREIRDNPRVAGVTPAQLRPVISSILAADWFDATLRRGHETALKAFDTLFSSGVMDLRGLKAEAHQVRQDLRKRVEDTCQRLVGEPECGAHGELEQRDQQARYFIESAPDQFDPAEKAQGEEAARVRTWVGRAPILRWLGAGVLLVLFFLVVLVNVGRMSRVLASCGLALIVAAGLSVPAQAFAAGHLRGELEKRIAAIDWRDADPVAARVTPPVLARFSVAMVDGAAAKARLPLIILGAFGGVLFLGSFFARRD